jgi:HSP20 family protein
MLDEMMEDAFSWSKGTFVPELNVYETDKEFEITVALPGMSKDDIDISFENNIITISGERKLKEENGTKYHRIESRFGKFERSLPLPNVIDEESISASYENGVLTVNVPKLKEKAGKKIEVN